MALEFRLLGDVAGVVDGRLIDLGHARQRCVLAALLVDAGRVVSADALLDRVWADSQPQHARNAVSGYVSRLRQALAAAGDEAQLHGVEGGYRLVVEPRQVDVHRFRDLVAQARTATDDLVAFDRFNAALELWQGMAFAGLDTPWLNSVRTTLETERLAATLDRNDLALRLGRHADLLDGLTKYAQAYPLDERVAGQLMHVLYRCGRQADALRHYESIRSALADEVGVDPGSSLQVLYHQILNADPSLRVDTRAAAVMATAPVEVSTVHAPRQLPRGLPFFVGRDREQATLAALLEAGAAAAVGLVAVIHGAPGAGKSALAVRAAHTAVPRFPDGQLHVNLCGATPGIAPLSAAEALHRLLRGLGITATAVPTETEDAAALFRTVAAERRLLVILDNAATAAQVRPLLPGSPGSVTLVTSRKRLAALEGATHLRVDPFTPHEAYMMLEGLVSGARTAVEPEATERLAALCGHLPLGLHVAAARLNARPNWVVRDLVERLTDERSRLTELATDDIELRGSLAVSHTALHDSHIPGDRSAARALRVFGLLPVTDFDLHLAAAVLGTSAVEADRIIERLMDAHLVEETTPGSFRMHDLTRLFAHELGAETIPPPEQQATFTALLSYYLATTASANMLVYPHRAHHPVPAVATSPAPLADHEEAWQWLDEQHPNIIAAIQHAWRGPTPHVRLGVGLGLALHWYLYAGARGLPETISFLEDVVTAAEQLGDRRSLAYAHGNLALNLRHIGQLDAACVHSSAELAICREVGDRFGEQRALGNLGYTHLAGHHPDQAIIYLQQQLDLARDIKAPIGQAFALVNLGKAHHQLGRSTEGITLIENGLSWYEKIGDHYRQCDVHEVLAHIHIDLGQFDQAITLMTYGLVHARHIGYRFGEIWALITLAQAHRLSGNINKARDFAEQAVTASTTLEGTQARIDAITELAQLSPSSRP